MLRRVLWTHFSADGDRRSGSGRFFLAPSPERFASDWERLRVRALMAIRQSRGKKRSPAMRPFIESVSPGRARALRLYIAHDIGGHNEAPARVFQLIIL